MNTKQLRQKILDLAIHGRLVPQDPNDEPASVLLERIRAEKEQLIKEGKIKRSKKSAKTSDMPHYEQVPFEVPEGWVWCNICDITSKITDGTHNSPQNFPKGEYKYITAKNIKTNGVVVDNITYVDKETHQEIFSRCNPELGDILYIKDGATTGVATINNLSEPFSLLSSVALIKPLHCISNRFLCYFLQSDICYASVRESMKGVGITRITLKQIEKWIVPLPPLAEQQRIVAEIEKWFALVDIIEQGKDDLQATIAQAKSKILDLAIHGKLVPQDPTDEPAIELLRRINPKFTPCDNGKYGQLPAGWTVAKLSDVYLPMTSAKPQGESFLYIDIDAIDNKRNVIDALKRIPTANAPSRALRYTRKGDVVFSMVRPYLKNIARVNCDQCIASTGFYVCSSNGCIDENYNYYLLLSDYVVMGLNHFMKGDNSPSITKTEMDNFCVPTPPLSEQQRIAQKVNILFNLLDTIQSSIETQ